FANPSAISRSEAEKEQLAEVLQEVGLIVPVIEDAAYRELWFEAPWPARSILALEAFEPFPRLYCGTLTKPFASGLKIGYLHASSPAIFERMLWLKGHQDFGSAHFNQAILEHVIRSGGFDAFLARLRPGYASKMDTLDRALEEAGLRALGWRWERPAGGLYLWVRAPEGVSTELNGPLWKACVEEEVMYVPGGLCIAGPADSRHVRLSFGVLDHAALREAAARFARAARRAAPRRA
ncbi:MAG: aminotransferase class I/II-fold pyridoxal phosphate-dependent enzyme, partial [Verrucomicrobia bacterium]